MAGFDTRRRASPPAAGTVQMSPPEAKAISERSGAMAGSVKSGRGAGACAVARGAGQASAAASASAAARNREWISRI